MKRKTLLIAGIVGLAAVGAYFAFRKKSLRFYDNVWCGEDNNHCADIDVATYIQSSRKARNDGGSNNLNLLFTQPHGLKAGDEIYIKQDKPFTFESYNGQASVAEVYTDYIIRTNKARMGNTPIEGGEVILL
tara:strand:+ start:32 stop:427 length:396 start_codon:yes stop_codon:yes gene_type:complete